MGFGLQTRNDSGVYQFDETFVNLCLVAKGTIEPGAVHPLGQPGANNVRYADVYYNGPRPVFCVSMGDRGIGQQRVAHMGTVRNGNDWTFRVMVCIPPNQASAYSYAFNYFIFDDPKLNTGGAGIWVFDGAGRLIYQSTSSLISIKGITPSQGYPGGRSYALLGGGGMKVNNLSESFTDGTIHDFYYNEMIGAVCYDNGIVLDTVTVAQGSGRSQWDYGGGLDGPNGPSGFLVIDVTDL